MFRKVLVANRGEIAVRVINGLRELGISSVAVHSDVDAEALHVQLADESVEIGGAPVADSYLRIDRIVEAALATGAEAVHPGYGLLSENPLFVEACEEAGLVFIGPSAASMRAMGSKIAARRLMREAGVPIVPGSTEPVPDVDGALAVAADVGYPVVVKASGAGGGKGMRVARSAGEIAAAFAGASGEGDRFFGDPVVYIERYLEAPRHVEVQILADGHGTVIHLFERDCSIQRRHQKLIEESPAPTLDDTARKAIGRIAVDAARAVGYRSAGTVEGLFVDGEFYFLEMNTRIQVEHPVTELVTGIDIVAEQVRIASGARLSITQSDVQIRGHAIECRINAEDASRNFLPQPGRVERYIEPTGPHIRVDSGVREGDTVSPFYDPLLAKLIVWGRDRREATERMLAALTEYTIDGLPTLLPFHRALLASAEWDAADACVELLSDRQWLRETGKALADHASRK